MVLDSKHPVCHPCVGVCARTVDAFVTVGERLHSCLRGRVSICLCRRCNRVFALAACSHTNLSEAVVAMEL